MIKYIKTQKLNNICIVLIIILVSFLQVATSLIHTFAFNALLQNGIKQFLVWYGIAFILWALLLIFNYLETVYQQKVIQKMSTLLREELTEKISKLDHETFSKNTIGNYTTWLNNDILMIENSGFSNFYTLIHTILITVFSLITLLQFHYSIMLTTIGFTLLMTFIPKYITAKVKDATSKVSKQNETFISKVQNLFQGFEVLFYANKTNTMRPFVREYSLELADTKILYTKQNGVATLIISILSVVSQLFIFVLTGVLAWLKIVSYGTITSTGSIAGNVFSSLTQLSNIMIQMKSVESIFEKHASFLDKDEVKYAPIKGEFKELKINNLSYQYGDNKVLEDINLVFTQGSKYAIVGESGRGKSTLLNIILGGKKDYIGSVKFNDFELNEIEDMSLHDYMAYINQDNFIFNGTIEENITLWDDYSKEKKEEVINRCRLEEIGSLNEPIGNGDRQLSEGQKQRINIARAMIQGKPILVIDEGTANLDHKNSEFIEEKILSDKNLTVIMVTHHLKDRLRGYYNQIIEL